MGLRYGGLTRSGSRHVAVVGIVRALPRLGRLALAAAFVCGAAILRMAGHKDIRFHALLNHGSTGNSQDVFAAGDFNLDGPLHYHLPICGRRIDQFEPDGFR
ncbi:hypothetical protein HRbin36_01356 [bacterium HR36]|nr:hypothetical protein HRbin36_01356 [bacterium HR36]